jgi:hypothetical protein
MAFTVKLAELRHKAVSLARSAMPWVGKSALVIAIYVALLGLIGSAINSDFFAAGPEYKDFSMNTKETSQAPIEVVLRFLELSEATNTAHISVGLLVRGPLQGKIKSGEENITVHVFTGTADWGKDDGLVITLNKANAIELQNDLWSPAVSGNMLVFRSVEPYPFDNYTQQFVIELKSTKDSYPYDTRIEKMIAGRRLLAKGESQVIDLELDRPLSQKMFVCGAAIVFFLVVTGVAVMLVVSPTTQTPQSLLLTVAGFLLSAAGFRDLMGFSKLPSFGTGDALVIGIPLLILAAAFLRVAYANKAGISNDVSPP